MNLALRRPREQYGAIRECASHEWSRFPGASAKFCRRRARRSTRMTVSFDETAERAARRLSQVFTRRSLLAKAGAVTLLLGGGEGGVLAFMSTPAFAAYSPLCDGCGTVCPGGTVGGNCWVGCDT